VAERRYKPVRRPKEQKKKGNYKFSDKTHPRLGIISVLFALAALIIMISVSYVSSRSKGNGNMYLGLFGLIAMVMSIFGLVSAIKSVNEKEILYTLPVIGLVVNGLLVIGCAILYFIGLV
jgi:lipopolysaccharide export LptBFGC system permease protein LptF